MNHLINKLAIDKHILYPTDFEMKYIKISNPLSDIYASGPYSDVEFHVQDQIFKVHKLILMATSDYFAAEIAKLNPE